MIEYSRVISVCHFRPTIFFMRNEMFHILIEENYSENITINDIGKAVGLSPSYLCACFRNATKTSINRYLNNIRCNEAKRLLTEENISVTEAATQCGFNNMSYFSRMYRNIIGELPSQTLKRVNNNHPPA